MSYRGIQAAKAAKFERIKLNAVIMRGRNDDEVLDLVQFALDNGLDLSFIEEMPLGDIDEHNRSEVFVSSAELRTEVIAAKYPLQGNHRKYRWTLALLAGDRYAVPTGVHLASQS